MSRTIRAGGVSFDDLEGFLALTSALHRESLAAEQIGHQVPDPGIIVDDQGCSAVAGPTRSRRSGPPGPFYLPGGRLQPAVEVGDRAWPAEIVPLDHVAREVGQGVPGCLILDALGDHPQPQSVPQLDRRSGDRAIVVHLRHMPDEGVVDFEHIDRELLEVG